jgi:hypothetical protein
VNATDEIEFRRVLAAPNANGRQLRDAVDIVVNGASLTRTLDGSPFDVEQIHQGDLPAAWSRTTGHVAILNCGCGDVGCGDFVVNVTADATTIRWHMDRHGRSFAFDRADFERSLRSAVSG